MVFDQDTDEVIMIINFYIELGNESEKPVTKAANKKQERIHVNDKTATGGWF